MYYIKNKTKEKNEIKKNTFVKKKQRKYHSKFQEIELVSVVY